MRSLMLLVVNTLTSIIAFAQWPHCYGYDSYDMDGHALVECYDHGFYIAGAERLNSNDMYSGFVMKTDINGNLLWKRYIKYSDIEYDVTILGISQSPDGGVFISGAIKKDYINCDGFYMKFNACSEQEWCAIIPIPGYSYCDENVILPDGSFIIHGEVQTSSHHRIWLYKINPSGVLLWRNEMEVDTGYFNETGFYMSKTIDSSILITGIAFSYRDPNYPDLGWSTPLWVKFDYDGNQIWDLPWHTSTKLTGRSNRSIQSNSGDNFCTGNFVDEAENINMGCIYRVSREGVPQGFHVYTIGDASNLFAIEFFPDSTLFLGGQYAISGEGYSMVVKSDTIGNVISSMDVPLAGYPVGYSITTSDNKVLAIGERLSQVSYYHLELCAFKFNQNLEYDSVYTVPITYDSLCPNPITAVETYILDCPLVSTPETEKKEYNPFLKIYPNPASNYFMITLPDYFVEERKGQNMKVTTTYYQLPGEKKIEVLDVNGRMVHSMVLEDGQNTIFFDSNDWPSGLYLIRLNNEGKLRSQGKLIKR